MGQSVTILRESFPPKSQFSTKEIPDLTGRVIIVTGGNTGIGKETVKALLQHNARVYLAARDEQKAQAAIQDLAAATGKEALFLSLDLSDLKAIKASAEEFTSKEPALHVLFNNAGVMASPMDQLTHDGYDLQFGTNVLGHFYFTKLLIPSLLEGAKTSPDRKARIVHTSSIVHVHSSGLDFNTFRDGPARRRASPRGLYSQSKFGNIVIANEFAKRYGDSIVSSALNPGNIETELRRHSSWLRNAAMKNFLYSVQYGALTQLYAGTMPQGLELNEKYLVPWASVGTPRPETQDPKLGEELWRWCEDQVKDL